MCVLVYVCMYVFQDWSDNTLNLIPEWKKVNDKRLNNLFKYNKDICRIVLLSFNFLVTWFREKLMLLYADR